LHIDVQTWMPGVLEGLVSHTLFSLASQASRVFRLGHAKDINSRVRNSITSAGLESVVGSGPLAEGAGEELRSFLSSAEAEVVVRQIYSFRLTDSKNGGLESIRSEFSKLLQGRVRGVEDRFARLLFKVILDASDEALKSAVVNGSIEALDVRHTIKHRMLLDELSAIKNNLELLSSKPNIQEILDFENKYRGQVALRHDSISPPHLDRQKKFPIDSLYVAPNLVPYTGSVRQYTFRHQEHIKTEHLLSTIHRSVLLGDPGAGKSTFALKLCHDLSTSGTFAGRKVTPILVVLRDYGAQKKEQHCSIIQFIETRSAAWYQVPAPPQSFEYLLLNGRAVIIFDGLDELLETSYRREIGDDIETFSNLYPSTPVIVTSRVVGYEQAPLDPKKFESYRLTDFDEDQVKEYSLKWFNTDDGLTRDSRVKRAQAFLKESRSVPDLRSNPLMLALMCNIYLGEDFIPTNRPDVYKKCALMLFDRWDRSRQIHTGWGFENQLSPIMAHIAHWLYSNPSQQGGVTEQQLVQECAKYLHHRSYEHIEEAEKAGTDFIEFCRGRAWVFSDTGTKPDGTSLYQFTHRTFLEYFTAHYLFRTNPKPTELLGVLQPRIAKREWDVVAQLAFHISSREVERGGDELLLGLLAAASSKPQGRLNFLTFAGRCMEFVSCSPKVSRAVTEATLAEYFSFCSKIQKSGKLLRRTQAEPESEDVVGNLLHTGADNRKTVAETIERLLCQHINGTDQSTAALAAETAVMLPALLHRRSDVTQDGDDLSEYWYPVWSRLVDSTLRRLEEIFRTHLFVARAAHFRRLITTTQLVDWHGPKPVLKDTPSSVTLSFWTAIGQPSLYHVIFAPFSSEVAKWAEQDNHALEEIGTALLRSHTPWSSRPDFVEHFMEWTSGDGRAHYYGATFSQKPPSTPPQLTTNAIFGAFVLAAAAMEALERTKQGARPLKRLSTRETRLGLLQPLQRTLLARVVPTDASQIVDEMTAAGFTHEQSDFAVRWATDKLNLIRHHGKRTE
jgi:NACHT domain-containing protein